jgi:hypothetical protein
VGTTRTTAARSSCGSRLRAERAAVLARLTPDWSEADLAELISLLARLNHDITANRDLLGARLENA